MGSPRAGQGRLLRRERPLAEAVLSEVAAEVRAARHVPFLDAAVSSDRSSLQGPPRRGLWRADGLVGHCGGVGRGGLGLLWRRRRKHGAPEAPGWVRNLLPAPVVVWPGDPRRPPCGAGAIYPPAPPYRTTPPPPPRLPPPP